MERRHVRLFNEYTQLAIFEDVYAEWKKTSPLFAINESDEWDSWLEDESMSSGEERALRQGLQVMSKPQMAALYLFALGKEEDEPGNYIKMIDGIDAFMYTDETDPSFSNITVPAMADAIGMNSDRTLTRTVNKFRNLIKGEGETVGEVLYNKVITAFEQFDKQNPTQLAILAAEAIQDASYTTNRDKAEERKEKTNVRAAERRQEKKLEGDTAAESIFKVVSALMSKGLSAEMAVKLAINRIAKETGYESTRLRNAYQKFVMSKGGPGGYYYA